MLLTSRTSPIRVDTVSVNDCNGMIGMTLCPGKREANANSGDWERDLDCDLKAIRDMGSRALVSLMETEEMAWFGVADLPVKTRQLGMEHFHLPIIDMDIPDDEFEQQWNDAGKSLRDFLLADELIVIHCLGGLGRTGTISGRLLVELGEDPASAIQRIRAARPGAIQTIMQETYVRCCKPV